MAATDVLLNTIIDRLSALAMVRAVGISGCKTPLPKPGEGDIEMCIYCDTLHKDV